MRCWCIKNGVQTEDKVDDYNYWELLAHTIVFMQFENGGKLWDWDRMTFIDKS